MNATPEHATAEWPCPMGLTFAKRHENCIADACPLWRWVPLSAMAPDFTAAVKAKVEGDALKHKEAVAFVMANREALGLPTKPTHGFCGLGGA